MEAGATAEIVGSLASVKATCALPAQPRQVGHVGVQPRQAPLPRGPDAQRTPNRRVVAPQGTVIALAPAVNPPRPLPAYR